MGHHRGGGGGLVKDIVVLLPKSRLEGTDSQLCAGALHSCAHVCLHMCACKAFKNDNRSFTYGVQISKSQKDIHGKEYLYFHSQFPAQRPPLLIN